VVDNETYRSDNIFNSVLKAASSGEDALFSVSSVSLDKAREMLKSNAVVGYVDTEGGLHAVVAASGLDQTILKSFLDSYLQMSQTAQTLLKQNPAAAFTGLLNDLNARRSYVRPLGGMPKPETLLAYFYALLAMTCMYGSFFGAHEVMEIQANLSSQGARISVAPVHKLKVFMACLSACMLIQYSEMLLVIAFLRFVLGIDFGSQTGYVLLLSFVGSVMGITFGAAVAAIGRKSEGATTGILVSVSMILSFFAGLMVVEMKYIVAKAFPPAAYINPAALVADGFYALYYYADHSRFWLNVLLLAAFSALFCALTYRAIRRRKYASL
jgi:ABC-2 type transport system permease protein